MADLIPEISTRISVKIDTSDLDRGISMSSSENIPDKVGDILGDMVSQMSDFEQPIAYAIADRLKSHQEEIIADRHYRSGKMANSVEISSEGENYLVGNTARSIDGFPYPLAIEMGRGPVYPLNRGVLRWEDNGNVIYSRYSSPVPPDPFVRPSIDSTISEIKEIVLEELRGVLK